MHEYIFDARLFPSYAIRVDTNTKLVTTEMLHLSREHSTMIFKAENSANIVRIRQQRAYRVWFSLLQGDLHQRGKRGKRGQKQDQE